MATLRKLNKRVTRCVQEFWKYAFERIVEDRGCIGKATRCVERRTHSIDAAITEQYSTEGNDKKMVNKAKCLTMGGEARK